MKLRRIGVVLALLTAVSVQALGGASPSAGEPSTMRRIQEAHMPSTALHATLDRSSGEPTRTAPIRPRTPAEFLAAEMKGKAKSLLDPRTIARAEDAFLEATTGGEVIDLGSILSGAGAFTAAPEGAPMALEDPVIEHVQVGYPAGDLDGDGRDDVLSIDVYWDRSSYDLTSAVLTGVSGDTGAELWSRTLTGMYDFFIVMGSNLNAEAGNDIVLLQLSIDEGTYAGPCTYEVCLQDGSYTWSWQLSPLNGNNGADLWNKTYPGGVTYTDEWTDTFFAGQFGEYFVVDNGGISLRRSGEDLIINAFDYEGVFGLQYASAPFVFGFSYEELVFVTTEAELLDGSSGSALFARTSDPQMGGAMLLPAGQAVGDAAEDLLWFRRDVISPAFACAFALVGTCVAPARAGVSVDMIDGGTYAKAWSTSIDDPTQEWGGLWPAGADLDGDGAADFFYYQYLATGLRQGMLSGSTGTSRWSTDSDAFLDVIGPVGGTPGDDLMATTFMSTGNGWGVDLARLDGSTGLTLFRTSFAPSAESMYADYWSYPFGDVDDDGTLDVMISEFNWSPDSYSFADMLESGRTGDRLMTRTDADDMLLRGGDLDGDGGEDGLTLELRSGAIDSVDLTALALPSGDTLWSRTDEFGADIFWDIWVIPSRDLSGLGGEDLIYNQVQRTAEYQSRTFALEGGDGTQLWMIGGPFDPPAPVTGAITGTVTSSSTPLEGMCVEAYGWDVYRNAYATTLADGTYTLAPLPDGRYEVRFSDCGIGRYETQYYQNRAYYYDADLVSVVDGQVVSGIDADLVRIPDPTEYVLKREEQKEYIGVGGDLFVSGPLPGGLYNDCTQNGPSTGGTCFQILHGEKAVEISIDDSSGEVIGGFYQFSDTAMPLPATFEYDWFCGSTLRIPVPPEAAVLWVFTQTTGGPLECNSTGVPVTGFITASFFGPQ